MFGVFNLFDSLKNYFALFRCFTKCPHLELSIGGRAVDTNEDTKDSNVDMDTASTLEGTGADNMVGDFVLVSVTGQHFLYQQVGGWVGRLHSLLLAKHAHFIALCQATALCQAHPHPLCDSNRSAREHLCFHSHPSYAYTYASTNVCGCVDAMLNFSICRGLGAAHARPGAGSGAWPPA